MIKFNQVNILKHSTNKITQKYMDNIKDLETLLHKIKSRAEFEISDTHYYRPINEGLYSKNKKMPYKGAALTISQDETNKAQHMIEISLLHPTMATEIKRPLAMGNKKEIIEYLNDNNTLNNIRKDISEMSQKLSAL